MSEELDKKIQNQIEQIKVFEQAPIYQDFLKINTVLREGKIYNDFLMGKKMILNNLIAQAEKEREMQDRMQSQPDTYDQELQEENYEAPEDYQQQEEPQRRNPVEAMQRLRNMKQQPQPIMKPSQPTMTRPGVRPAIRSAIKQPTPQMKAQETFGYNKSDVGLDEEPDGKIPGMPEFDDDEAPQRR